MLICGNILFVESLVKKMSQAIWYNKSEYPVKSNKRQSDSEHTRRKKKI